MRNVDFKLALAYDIGSVAGLVAGWLMGLADRIESGGGRK